MRWSVAGGGIIFFVPADDLPQGIKQLLTFVIPYGLAAFYPVSYLLDRDVSLVFIL